MMICRSVFGRNCIAAMVLAFTSPVIADASVDFDFLTFAAIENFNGDKQWCAEKYPQFKGRNEVIFGKSIFAGMTGESFIQANALGAQREKLLGALAQMRSDRKSEYEKMPLQFLENMCSAFDAHLGKENMRAPAGVP